MTKPQISFRSVLRLFGLSACFVVLQVSAQAQTSLSGVVQFSANSNGSALNSSGYENTLGGDLSYDLWLALDPDARLPVNGPSDQQSAISIPLEAGKSYRYYTFANGTNSPTYTGINLFFNGNNSTPGISAFGPNGGPDFFPNSNTTDTLQITSVTGSGTTYYQSGGLVVVLTGFNWNQTKSPYGNVCQPYEFAPGSVPVYFGSFSLHVFPSATLVAGAGRGSPLSKITMSGSGFAPQEQVSIYANGLGSSLLATATTDDDGSFSESILGPERHYGVLNFFALGETSGKLGTASFLVTPSLTMNPASVAPGGTTIVQGLGFGAGETVTVYMDEPRVILGTATANILGSFINSAHSAALQVTIPTSATPGLNALIGVGGTTGAIGIGKISVK